MYRKLLLQVITIPLLCVLFTHPLFAQTKVVSGRVTDAQDSSGISGVSVQVKGGKTGTQTGADGTFKITVPQNTNTLTFSSISVDLVANQYRPCAPRSCAGNFLASS